MAAYRTVALLTATVLALLTGCAGDEQMAAQNWSGRNFYPPEICLGIYDGRHAALPDYWRIRRWCDRREMQDSWDL